MIQDYIKHDYWLWLILSLAAEDKGRGNQAKREEPGAHQATAVADALEQPVQPSSNACNQWLPCGAAAALPEQGSCCNHSVRLSTTQPVWLAVCG